MHVTAAHRHDFQFSCTFTQLYFISPPMWSQTYILHSLMMCDKFTLLCYQLWCIKGFQISFHSFIRSFVRSFVCLHQSKDATKMQQIPTRPVTVTLISYWTMS